MDKKFLSFFIFCTVFLTSCFAENCARYVEFMNNFIKEYQINSVVDLENKDFELFKETKITYLPIKAIDYDIKNLPIADLLICRDIFQNTSHENLLLLIDQFKKYKYCLITTEINRYIPSNTSFFSKDCDDTNKLLYNLSGIKVLLYSEDIALKQVFLINNTKAPFTLLEEFYEDTTKRLKTEKIIICGVCKNVEKTIPSTIKIMEQIGSFFLDYRIFIYENNSKDKTAKVLKEWECKNKKVSCTCEVLNKEALLSTMKSHKGSGDPCRIGCIARARNIVLQKALSQEFDDYKYIVMMDMDFSKWNINGIINSFQQKTPWDGIFANGIVYGYYYDRFAYRDERYPLGPELIGQYWWKQTQKEQLNFDVDMPLYPVYSAFGGLGIYKRDSIKNCIYYGDVTLKLESVVRNIIETNKNNTEVLRFLDEFNKNKRTNFIYLSNDKNSLPWVINSGCYGFPICCEHVIFHANMLLNGFGKLFVNPKMTTEYDSTYNER